jgi:hypothetical protein
MGKLGILKLFLTILILSLQFESNSQSVYVYSGKVCQQKNESFDSFYDRLIAELQKEALTKSGVKVSISDFTLNSTSEKNNQFTESFFSNTLTTTQGYVKDFEIIKEIKGYDKEFDCFFLDVEIKATVKKYKTKIDPKFKLKIDGIKSVYKNNDQIDFKVFAYENCYLNIFYLSDNNSSMLFPYNENKNNFLSSNSNLVFNEYSATLENETESGILMFVITKNNFPFEKLRQDENGLNTITTNNDIFNWLFSIEPNDRNQYYFDLIVE